MQRSDKLRDDLRGKAVSTNTWRCIIPDCPETAVNKSRWLDHIKQHDQETRCDNMSRLTAYGLNELYGQYLRLQYLCKRSGCPFGTNTSGVMDEHLLIPHDGPHCPCPIPDCQTICKTWEAVAQHCAAGHSDTTRFSFQGEIYEQGFDNWNSAFTCPVSGCLYVSKRYVRYAETLLASARDHCQRHNFEELLAVAMLLVDAWRACAGNWYLRVPFLKIELGKPTSNQIFASLAFSDDQLSEAKGLEDLHRLCVERGINLP